MNRHTCVSLITIAACCSQLSPAVNLLKSRCLIKLGILCLVFLPVITEAQSSTESTIWAEAAVGQGATFYFTMDSFKQEVEQKKQSEAAL